MIRDCRREAMVLLAAACILAMVPACGPSNDRDISYHQGLYAFEQGRWDWARVYLEQDLEHNPERVESLRLLGISWISGLGGGLSRGAEILDLYLEQVPDDQAIRRRLVSTRLITGNVSAAKAAARLLDDSPPSLYQRAQTLAVSDPHQALELLARALAKDKNMAEAHALTALILERLGSIELARDHANRAMALNPFNQKVVAQVLRLARVLGDSDQAGRALAVLEVVARLHQSREAATLAPAQELRLIIELEALLDTLEYSFNHRKALVLMAAGHIDKGESTLLACRSHPRFATLDRLQFAKLLALGGRFAKARELYQEARTDQPTNSVISSSLALLSLRERQPEEADKIVTAALTSTPHSASLHAARGAIKLRLGATQESIQAFQQALLLAPWESAWRLALADILRSEGRLSEVESLLAAAPESNVTLKAYERRFGGPAHVSQDGDRHPGPITVAIKASSDATVADGDAWFVDVTDSIGLDFVQYDGRSGERFYIETTGSGCAMFDYDGDGDLDFYLLTGAPTPGSAKLGDPPLNALFENRDGRFVDVAAAAGVADPGFGMGVCVGDVDGDGLLDMMVANYGPDRLFRNLGGRFEEVAEAAGVADSRWSSNCAFGDVDSDGDLDLYVSHYLDFEFANNPFCGDRVRGISAYCRPSAFEGVTDSLFINRGDGTFRDEAVLRGIATGVLEKGFGVVMTDIDDDGDLDIFVANDSTPNRLFVNDGGGHFVDQAMVAGLALNQEGRPTSGMGVAVADLDGDLASDVVVTNYGMEANGLYRNIGPLTYEDVSQPTGMAAASMVEVGWGVQAADFDNDGDLDLAVANGHVVDNIALFEPGIDYPQRNRLLINDGHGSFSDGRDSAGQPWSERRVSRALAAGDWNNDGRIDLLVANCNDRFQLLENRVLSDHHWVGLGLVGPPGNRAAIGARVLLTAGELRLRREVRSGGSFQAQSDLRLHFGLGSHQGSLTADIRWPDGFKQTLTLTGVDRYHEIRRSDDKQQPQAKEAE